MTETVLEQQPRVSTNEHVFTLLFENDEVTWKQIIFGLIEAEQMDPWDIDLSKIARQFLKTLKTLKQLDFRISGKMVLASAVLLKMKSVKLMEEEIAALDQLINSAEEPFDLGLDGFPIDGSFLVDAVRRDDRPRLYPKTPQPRKRKVSVYDLVQALEQALELDSRRVRTPPRMITIARLPDMKVDMGVLLQDVYGRVNDHYKQENAQPLSFDDLVPGGEKEDKIFTFIPLLHLDFQRKVDLRQKKQYGRIDIKLLQKDASFTEKEIAAAT